MAIFTRINGDLQPVVVMDSGIGASGAGFNNGANAVVNGATVNVMGPKLDFFTVAAGGAVTADEMAAAVLTVQQRATIYMYNADIATGDLILAVYPTAAWSTTTLDTDIQALGGGWAAATSTASATF